MRRQKAIKTSHNPNRSQDPLRSKNQGLPHIEKVGAASII
jgi:hypothetical protein